MTQELFIIESFVYYFLSFIYYIISRQYIYVKSNLFHRDPIFGIINKKSMVSNYGKLGPDEMDSFSCMLYLIMW